MNGYRFIPNAPAEQLVVKAESRRNEPCGCGSGRKAKHCHGAGKKYGSVMLIEGSHSDVYDEMCAKKKKNEDAQAKRDAEKLLSINMEALTESSTNNQNSNDKSE